MNAMQFGLRDWALREPDRIAAKTSSGRATTFADLEALVNRLAHLFRKAGLVRGDHIACILGNDINILAIAWACYRTGLYFTPVANALAAQEATYIVSHSQARLVIADARYAAAASGLPRASGMVRCFFSAGGAIDGFQTLQDALSGMPCEPVADETPGAIMLYSSGTTGTPKGIWRPLPSPELIADGPPPFARDLISLFGIKSTDRYLSTAPLYHAAPLRWSLATIAAGGCVTIMDRFDAGTALGLLTSERITISQWVPTMFHRMLALPLEQRQSFRAPAHRVAYHAAAPISIPLKQAMIDWWGPILHEYYSGSESIGMCSLTSEEWARWPGSVGRCRKGRLHILDQSYRELGPNEPGMIFFSGIQPFEYFGEPEKTRSRTSPQGYQTIGDIGYVNEDGYLFLLDRLDDMIISGGVNIYPQEIERVLDQAPGVAESGVVGVQDAEFGERPVAFVQPTDTADRDRLRAELFAYCRQRLGRTKQPREIMFVETLPRSETGKLLRRALRTVAAPVEQKST